MSEVLATEVVKGGGRTLFVDIRRAKNEKVYATVTSLGRNKDGDDERRSVHLFGQEIPQIAGALATLIKPYKEELKSDVASVQS